MWSTSFPLAARSSLQRHNCCEHYCTVNCAQDAPSPRTYWRSGFRQVFLPPKTSLWLSAPSGVRPTGSSVCRISLEYLSALSYFRRSPALCCCMVSSACRVHVKAPPASKASDTSLKLAQAQCVYPSSPPPSSSVEPAKQQRQADTLHSMVCQTSGGFVASGPRM